MIPQRTLLPTLACLLSFATAVGASEQPFQPSSKRHLSLPTGVELAYLDLGPADGEAVVFLHGFTDTARSFAPLVAELQHKRPDLRLIVPDLRGHGGSSLPSDHHCRSAPQTCFTPARQAQDIVALLDSLGIERASAVGHCYGSFIALELAMAEPRRVRNLGLLASAARTSDHELILQMRGGLIEGAWRETLQSQGLIFPDEVFDLPALAVGEDAKAWISGEWVTEAGAPAGHLAAILPETLATPLGTWIGTIRALATWDASVRLGAISAPTLVLWTSGDPLFPEQPYQQELRRALGDRPTVRFSQVESATDTPLGHNFHWAAPAEVATELARFLPRGGA